MAKPNPYEKEMFAGLSITPIDNEAYTSAEIRARHNMSEWQLRLLIKRKLGSGEWERVYKKVNGKSTAAYRPAKR